MLEPVIKFMETKFYAKEPPPDEESRLVEIPIFRSGDTSKDSVVTVYTKDGSAKSGIHYEPFAKVHSGHRLIKLGLCFPILNG